MRDGVRDEGRDRVRDGGRDGEREGRGEGWGGMRRGRGGEGEGEEGRGGEGGGRRRGNCQTLSLEYAAGSAAGSCGKDTRLSPIFQGTGWGHG